MGVCFSNNSEEELRVNQRASIRPRASVNLPLNAFNKIDTVYIPTLEEMHETFEKRNLIVSYWTRTLAHIEAFPVELIQLICEGYYEFAVPPVLEYFRSQLLETNGLETSGIFRISGNQTSVQKASNILFNDSIDHQLVTLNNDLLTRSDKNIVIDCHLYAQLIKLYYRHLEINLFSEWSNEELQNLSRDAKQCLTAITETLTCIERGFLLWISDLAAVVASHADENRMTVKNMAIILSPCFMNIDLDFHPDYQNNPMALMMRSQHMVLFVEKCIEWRLLLMSQ